MNYGIYWKSKKRQNIKKMAKIGIISIMPVSPGSVLPPAA